MLFSRLQYWWEIYAPFQAVSTIKEEKNCAHPHRGQVIHYKRVMNGKTRQEVARALHWSSAYIRKIETRPEGTGDLERDFNLIPYLQISPKLLNIPEDFFIPDTPDGAHAALMEQLHPLLDDLDAKKEEIASIIGEYEYNRAPNYLPLSAQAKRICDDVAIRCLITFGQMTDPGELMNWITSIDDLVRKELHIGKIDFYELDPFMQRSIRKVYEAHKLLPSHLIRRDKLLEGLALMEEWQEKLSKIMDQTTGFRRDQLLYAKCSLYETVGYLQLFKPVIDAELGPEKRLDYATCWLTCAQLLGNVVLMARPLLERMMVYLEQSYVEQALEDFHLLQSCIDVMGHHLGCWSDARMYVYSLNDCIALAKGGMKLRLRNYQRRTHDLIEARMASMEQ